MTKEQRNIIVEYVTSLVEDDVRSLSLRLTDRFFGDLPEALNLMSKNLQMDAILASAQSANDLFDLLDKIRDIATKELKKRGQGLKPTS